jgi:hypothetical protein
VPRRPVPGLAGHQAAARDTAVRERDAAVGDAQRATVDLAAARQVGEDTLTAARRQAERKTVTVQAACQAREEFVGES